MTSNILQYYGEPAIALWVYSCIT